MSAFNPKGDAFRTRGGPGETVVVEVPVEVPGPTVEVPVVPAGTVALVERPSGLPDAGYTLAQEAGALAPGLLGPGLISRVVLAPLPAQNAGSPCSAAWGDWLVSMALQTTTAPQLVNLRTGERRTLPAPPEALRALAVSANTLYAGSGNGATCYALALTAGSPAWTSLPAPPTVRTLYTICSDGAGGLLRYSGYIGSLSPSTMQPTVERWNGSVWSTLTGATLRTQQPRVLRLSSGRLFVQSAPSTNSASFDGSAYAPAGAAWAVYDPATQATVDSGLHPTCITPTAMVEDGSGKVHIFSRTASGSVSDGIVRRAVYDPSAAAGSRMTTTTGEAELYSLPTSSCGSDACGAVAGDWAIAGGSQTPYQSPAALLYLPGLPGFTRTKFHQIKS